MDVDELASATGSYVSELLNIVYCVQFEGKKSFHVGNFTTNREATDKEIMQQADENLDVFFKDHFPDNLPRPKVVSFKRGALKLCLDSDWK